MALMLAIWRAQPNWIPRKPKLMFQIAEKRGGCSPMWPPGLPAMETEGLPADGTAGAGLIYTVTRPPLQVPGLFRYQPSKVAVQLFPPAAEELHTCPTRPSRP